jgi:hypothetical protein
MSNKNEKSKKSELNQKPQNKAKKQRVRWADLTEEEKRERQYRYFSMLNNFFKTK